MTTKPVTVLIASWLDPQQVQRIASAEPHRIEVIYEPDLLPKPRYVADHHGPRLQLSPTELDRWVSEVNEKRNELEHRFGIARNRTPLNAALAMLRWVNRLVPRSRHTWTGYVCGNRGYRSTRAPWGWKDPRNSITLPLWQAIYPDARVLVIRKEVDKTEAKSSSGEWFRDPNNRELIDRYRSPSFVGPRDRIKFVSFEDLTGDARHFNDLLVWIGLPTLTERQFRGLLEVTHFESATAAHRNPATSNVTAAAAATSVADGILREDFVIWLTQFQCF